MLFSIDGPRTRAAAESGPSRAAISRTIGSAIFCFGLAYLGNVAGKINLPIGMVLRCMPPEILAGDVSDFEKSGAAGTEIGATAAGIGSDGGPTTSSNINWHGSASSSNAWAWTCPWSGISTTTVTNS